MGFYFYKRSKFAVGEPSAEEVITIRKKNQKGKCEEDVKALPHETREYKLTDE